MSYCNQKSSATVVYSFKAGDKKKFLANRSQLPINVVAGAGDNSEEKNVNFTFDGSSSATYSFTIAAPASVPKNLIQQPKIYLTYGKWDDYGTIGSYSTGDGVVLSYSGNILIGNGYSVSGTVVNKLPIGCYFQGTLEWSWLDWDCSIAIFDKNNNKIFLDSGECPINFVVTCDDDCPEGFCKCIIPEYPGYCCLDCNATAASIRAITNDLRGKNG